MFRRLPTLHPREVPDGRHSLPAFFGSKVDRFVPRSQDANLRMIERTADALSYTMEDHEALSRNRPES